MTTKGDTISRIRNSIKAVNQDAFVTDRYIYALILKYAKLYIKRLDDSMKLAKFQSLFETIPCMKLVDSNPIEACCSDIKTCCTIKRSEQQLPPAFEGSFGSLITSVTSIDGSQILVKTYPNIYVRMTNSSNFKYNKTLYYWVANNYLFIPNVEWEAVTVEGLWEDSLAMYTCEGDVCIPKQEEPTSIPEHIFAQIEQDVRNELLGVLQIPQEPAKADNQSKLKD